MIHTVGYHSFKYVRPATQEQISLRNTHMWTDKKENSFWYPGESCTHGYVAMFCRASPVVQSTNVRQGHSVTTVDQNQRKTTPQSYLKNKKNGKLSLTNDQIFPYLGEYKRLRLLNQLQL